MRKVRRLSRDAPVLRCNAHPSLHHAAREYSLAWGRTLGHKSLQPTTCAYLHATHRERIAQWAGAGGGAANVPLDTAEGPPGLIGAHNGGQGVASGVLAPGGGGGGSVSGSEAGEGIGATTVASSMAGDDAAKEGDELCADFRWAGGCPLLLATACGLWRLVRQWCWWRRRLTSRPAGAETAVVNPQAPLVTMPRFFALRPLSVGAQRCCVSYDA